MLVSVASFSLGLPGTLVLVGLLLPALLLVSLPRLAAVDQSAEAPPARVLASLRSDPIFAPLAPSAIERVADRTSIVDAPAGKVIAREGEVGDRYYRVLAGELEVRITDRVVRRLGVGDSFGEIALLYAVPRTATVAALSPVTLVAVEHGDFLTTVTGDSKSRAEAETVARRFLGEHKESELRE
jgi:CRP-like cAMP-binding protein